MYSALWYIDAHKSIISYCPEEGSMSRLQLAINVSNLDEAIAFYTKMFALHETRLSKHSIRVAKAGVPPRHVP